MLGSQRLVQCGRVAPHFLAQQVADPLNHVAVQTLDGDDFASGWLVVGMIVVVVVVVVVMMMVMMIVIVMVAVGIAAVVVAQHRQNVCLVSYRQDQIRTIL